MAEPILMPRLTIDMEKGTVLEWTVEEGDSVEKGQKIAVVFGDKVEWEVEAPASGVLLKILVAPDAEAAVARPIGFVGRPGEEIPDAGDSAPPPAPAAQAAPGPDAAPDGPAPAGKPKASPAAKRIARERSVDLARVAGTGPGGRIVEADVLAFAGGAPPASAEPIPLAPLRRTIADRMQRSWRTAPHFTLECVADMTAARAFRDAHPGHAGKAYTYNDLVVAAVGQALAASEPMQRRWDGETLTRRPGSNLGVAVHTEEGLVVPVVENAGAKSLAALAREIREKAERARAGRLLPDDVIPAALTVTNLGMFGVTRFAPVINHPECAILAVGAVEERAVVRDGWLGARLVVTLDLALDHRALDGAVGARFLRAVREILEAGSWRI